MEAPEGSTTPAKSLNPNLTSKVRVIVRVRPFLPHEIAAVNGYQTPCASVIEHESQPSTETVFVHLKDKETSRKECYRLDSFFSLEDNNVARIFYREVSPLIPRIFRSFNSTVFAYGATGSGKTYTMQGTEEKPGLMPLAMSTILSMCKCTGGTAEISYYEVYMDRCYDLLEVKSQEIAVLDDKEGRIHLRGLSRVSIKSMQEFDSAFACGVQRRKTAHTGLNDVSSRSHGVLVICVSTPSEDVPGAVVTGKLNLIDLAGNEDNRRTCNEGLRLQESAKINQSLFSLSNVIYALNNNLSRVPYRQSKLTRILQDSLGGMSQALMVACLNPGEYQESVHTVSLAARSRHITNSVPSAQKIETPKVKVDMEAKLHTWLESRGKTKGAQRVQPLNSPFLGKPPLSSTKKFNSNLSSLKKLTTNRRDGKERTITTAVRNLFDEGPVDKNLESLVNAAKDKDDAEAGGFTSLPGETSNHDENPSSFVNSSPVGERNSTLKSPLRKVLSPVDTNINLKAFDELVCIEPRTPKTPFSSFVNSSPVGERNSTLKSPLRKVLSPVDTNINLKAFDELVCIEPRTPKTPFPVNCLNNRFQNIGTPLEKFTACGSQVKNYLVQEYVDFLNTANREELLEIKGIGAKYADYILGLRETSPLHSLNDLEKVGLSSKQIHNLLNKAALGVFDQQGCATPNCAVLSQVQ